MSLIRDQEIRDQDRYRHVWRPCRTEKSDEIKKAEPQAERAELGQSRVPTVAALRISSNKGSVTGDAVLARS
jgi:hypothetical protein